MPPWRVSIDRCFGPEEHLLSPPLRCPVHDNSPLSPPSEASDEICDEREQLQSGAVEPELHAAVWLGDVETVQAMLERRADVNAEDVHGVSPLMLAVELMPRSQEYSHMVACLLSQGAQPRRRSSAGWSPLDEAVSRADVQLVRTLFDAAQKDLRRRWDVRLSSIAKSLQLLPDFECRIRWEFESPVIPWLSKIAPSDVILVRKRGSCLRLDSTLASWKRFRAFAAKDGSFPLPSTSFRLFTTLNIWAEACGRAGVRSQWAPPAFSRDGQIAVGTAGLQPRLPDRNGAPPDFSRDCQIAVGTAGRQLRLPDRSGHWDCSRDCQIAVGTAGLQPRLPDRSVHRRTAAATARSQWALPDFSCNCQIAVGTAGLQPVYMPDRMPD
eukprot:s2980_g4.t1